MNIMATPLSVTEIRVEWEPVSERDKNGVITHYEVHVNQSDNSALPTTNSTAVNSPSLSVVLSGLHPFINYTITVRAFTSVGPGPLNPIPVLNTTDPSSKPF